MSGFPKLLAPDLFGPVPSGGFITPQGAISSGLQITNTPSIASLFLPATQKFSNFGINITVAGDASAISFIGLWRQNPGSNIFTQVLPEQTLPVAAGTGVFQAAINITLQSGRYLSSLRTTFTTTSPTFTARQFTSGGLLFAQDPTEATIDASRGGLHIGGVGGGYPGVGPLPIVFPYSSATRSVAFATFLQAA